jgi:hypothetical protein
MSKQAKVIIKGRNDVGPSVMPAANRWKLSVKRTNKNRNLTKTDLNRPEVFQ